MAATTHAPIVPMPPTSPFTLLDYRQQLAASLNPGVFGKMMNWLTGIGEIVKYNTDDRTCHQQLGIIDAMTLRERANPQSINRQRARRIARGAGVRPHDVYQLLHFHEAMVEIMVKMQTEAPKRLR